MRPALLALAAAVLSGCCFPFPGADSGGATGGESTHPPAPPTVASEAPPSARVVPSTGPGSLQQRVERNEIPRLGDRKALYGQLASQGSPVPPDGSFDGVLVCDLRVPEKSWLSGRPDMQAIVAVDGGREAIVRGDNNRAGTIITLPIKITKGARLELVLEDRDLFRNDRMDEVKAVFPGTLPWLWVGQRGKLNGTCLGLAKDEVDRRVAVERPRAEQVLDAFRASLTPKPAAPNWGYPAAAAADAVAAIDGLAALQGWDGAAAAVSANWSEARRTWDETVRKAVAVAEGTAAPVGEVVDVPGGRVRLEVSALSCGAELDAGLREVGLDPDTAGDCLLELLVEATDGRALPVSALAAGALPGESSLELVLPDGATPRVHPFAFVVERRPLAPDAVVSEGPVSVLYFADVSALVGIEPAFSRATMLRAGDGRSAVFLRLP